MAFPITSCGQFFPSKAEEKFHLKHSRNFFRAFTYAYTHEYKLNEPWVDKGKDGIKKYLTALYGSRFADSVNLRVKACVDSATELLTHNLATAEGKLKDQQKHVARNAKVLKKLLPKLKRVDKLLVALLSTKSMILKLVIFKLLGDVQILVQKQTQLLAKLHNQRARLQKLTQNVARMQKQVTDGPSICFGTKELFQKQFFLKENNYADHKAWLADWQHRKIRGYYCRGSGGKENNQLARITKWTDDGDHALVEVTINLGGKKQIVKTHITQHVEALYFAYTNRQSICVEILNNNGWHIHFSWDYESFFPKPTYAIKGTLGVDHNNGFLQIAHVKKDGNVVQQFRYKFKGQNAEDTKSKLARVFKRYIIPYAKANDLMVVLEDIDFSKKKQKNLGKKFNKMLGEWLTEWYQRIATYRCLESSVRLRLVNPAFTSIIGYVKFACGLGKTTHSGAAIAIGRRGMNLSERVSSNQYNGPCPKPARILGNRHPWSSWRQLESVYFAQSVNCERKSKNNGMSSTDPHGSPLGRVSPPQGGPRSFIGPKSSIEGKTLPADNCAVN